MFGLLFYALLTVMAGCGDIRVVRDETVLPNETLSRQYIKSYKIGEKKTISIGNPIVRWQEATIKTTLTPKKYIAKSNFELKGKYDKERKLFRTNIHIKEPKDTEYYHIGATSYNGTTYHVIAKNMKDNEHYLLINERGELNKNVLIDEHLDRKLISEDINSSPDDIVFIEGSNENTSQTVGLSREIIFGGVNNITLNATYREYTPDDMARQAFYQNLVYQTSAESIRFRDFKIKVHEVTNEQITFTVLEDGLTMPMAPTK